MVIIDFSDSPLESFKKGFKKGLGAPLMLYGNFQAPETPTVGVVVVANRVNDSAAIAKDWHSVGDDVRAAVKKYGEAATTA